MEPNANEPSVDDRDTARKEAKLQKVLEILEGEFDAFVIALTWQDSNEMTRCRHQCGGNWFTVAGLLRHLNERRAEDARIEQRDMAAHADEGDDE